MGEDSELYNEAIEMTRTHLEKIMMLLPKSLTRKERKCYLAGVIDTLADTKVLEESQRAILYAEYGF